jgi:sterol desaturase/sphingolipid hydroxylase (fatty acid hydroxylase superfamily)
MEFYLSFGELAGKISNPVSAVFLPIFLIVTALEAMVIIWRSGTYPWKNAGVSLCMALGHLITQATAHGLIFSIIAAAAYKIRLTTIPVSFNNRTSLFILFLVVDLGFYVEHRCSHRCST